MEVPHQYPYNPRLWLAPAFFGIGLLFIAFDWFPGGHIPTGFRFDSFVGLICIALALIVGVRRIWFKRYLLLDNHSMVLPIGLFQARTAKIEYTSIRHVWLHYTYYASVAVLRVATEKRTFEIVSTLLPDDESYCAVEEFLNRKTHENTRQKKQLAKNPYHPSTR